MTYRLYCGETACDSDDWGPPRSEHETLDQAIAASGTPAQKWETDRYCPDEVFTFWPSNSGAPSPDPQMSILHPGVATEFRDISPAGPVLDPAASEN